MNAGIKLEAKDVNLSYKKKKETKVILNKFSFVFEGQKIYLVKGRSGAGKTTLLSVLGLIQGADSGQILLNGSRVDNLSNEGRCEVRRNRIGIVFQEPYFIQGLSIRDNIALSSVCENPSTKKEVYDKCDEIAKLLQIESRLKAKPKELSGGERQRANIARAVIGEPDVLICDEPIANVDEENAQIIVNFIRKYGKEKNKLVIVACHTAYFDDIADQVINM